MAKLPKGPPTLRDVLREQRALQKKQGTASPYSGSGFSVGPDGSVSTPGTVTAGGLTTAGAVSGGTVTGGNTGPGFAIACGRVTITPATASVTASAPVTFPTGRFSTTPRVTVTPVTTDPVNNRTSTGGVTATGFTCYVNRNATTAIDIDWIAVTS